MEYLALKHAHVGFVALSGALFLLRGAWMLLSSPQLQQRWVRIVPHIVDSSLLISAVLLAHKSAQYPFVHTWLSAKVIALFLYIVLGTVALKSGRTKTIRAWAFAGALALFAYIVAVALSKQATIVAL
ncbi:SirB2 family protein [Massilia glaciei]|uniref:Regulator SirB n=1 Tax=Massilia glaciei TaxID=1524097 RepID=A0A2U2HEM4_9BURK|nr:SirB2 family protein [Massilia glaciei]PWF42097.1 regulator SirB [Massilia glaciei]